MGRVAISATAFALLVCAVANGQAQKPVVAENLEFSVLGVTRVQEWVIPGTEEKPNGPFRMTAPSGHEVVVIRLKTKRLQPTTGIDTASAMLHDATGKTHRANYFPAKVGTVEQHEAAFAFVVPKGVALAKIQLTPGIDIDVKGAIHFNLVAPICCGVPPCRR